MTTEPRLYAILTVKLDAGDAPANNAEAFRLLKAKLGLEHPVIDDVYGAQPADEVHPHMKGQLPKNSYFVLIDNPTWQNLLKSNHPNVVGIHHAAIVPSGEGPKPMSVDDIEKLRKMMQQSQKAKPAQPPKKKPGWPKFF